MSDCPRTDAGPTEIAYWLTTEHGSIPVRTYGQGAQLIIALHGFTYDGTAFKVWETVLGKDYRICALDLPFHGEAKWDKRRVTDEEIATIIQATADREGCPTFSALGHSMGARFIICTARYLSDRLERIILLAPAGIGSYERVAPLAVQRVVEYALKWPAWFKWIVLLGHRLGVVSNFHRRYAETQLFPNESRYLVFRILNSLPFFNTKRYYNYSHWQRNLTPTIVLLAEKDRMIPNESVKQYFVGNSAVTIVQVPGGHEMVNPNTAQYVRDWLEDTNPITRELP